MKPLDGTFAENALKWGVAGLNVEDGRIGRQGRSNPPGSPTSASRKSRVDAGYRHDDGIGPGSPGGEVSGRWPANLILVHHPDCQEAGAAEVRTNGHHPARRGHGGQTLHGHAGQEGLEERRPGTETVDRWECHPDCPVLELDRQSGVVPGAVSNGKRVGTGYGGGFRGVPQTPGPADSGTASRFFYQSKVSPSERNGSKHPTLKPIDLCRYLAKLILPPARKDEPRRLLVPFAGEGSEIIGALSAGWEEVEGIERDEEHFRKGAQRIRDEAPLIYQVELASLPLTPVETETAETEGNGRWGG